MRKLLAIAVMGSMFAVGCGETSSPNKGTGTGGPSSVSGKPGAMPPKSSPAATPPKGDGKSEPKDDHK
jgi:hypothetical protein